MTSIPPMTHRLSDHWDQPPRRDIALDDLNATMSETTFARLKNYSLSIPTGKYAGKMWKCQMRDGSWRLRWYEDSDDPNMLNVRSRNIVISDAAQPEQNDETNL